MYVKKIWEVLDMKEQIVGFRHCCFYGGDSGVVSLFFRSGLERMVRRFGVWLFGVIAPFYFNS